MHFNPKAAIRRAFTLLELLVVIAIIGILAALLLPSLSRSKNSAAKTTDIDNLKQQMTALNLFTSDNNDVLPAPNWDNGGFPGPQGTNTGWLYAVNLAASGTNRFHVDTGLFWSALQNPKLYFCPMDRPTLASFSAHDNQVEQRQQQISSYAMNGAIVGFMAMKYAPARLSDMLPTDCAFWETDETDPYYFNDGANWPSEGVSARHYQGAIQAAFDSSVSYIKLQIWYSDVAYTSKNRLWCYPNSPNGR
jgi:prepilin-type N-terminal cleavage/methylation domain-containing protein